MRKRNNLLLIGSLLISGISLSTLSSCNAVQKENELTSITTSDSELILSINETKTISITCNPSNYDVKKLKYSFDSNIISFNQDKLEITGLKKGETNLVISGGKNISTTINIKVEDILATSIDSSFSRKIIGIDEEIQINVTFSPSNITNKELSNSDYKKVNFKYLDDELEGYIFSPRESKILKNTFSASNNSKYYLFYAVNTLNGSESLYQFDVVENTVQKYNSEEVDFYKDMAHTYYLYVLVLLGTIVIIFLLLLVALVIKKNKSKKRNIVRDNDVVVIKEDNNDLDKDISNELEDNNYNKEELPIKDAKEELNDKNNKKKKKKKMEFEEL